MRGLAAGMPRSALVMAASLKDVRGALMRVSQHVEGRDKVEKAALNGISGASTAEAQQLRFRSWVRAGASMYSYVFREQEAHESQVHGHLDHIHLMTDGYTAASCPSATNEQPCKHKRPAIRKNNNSSISSTHNKPTANRTISQ